MKLKYYLRGIGIGMIVTALIFMIGASASNKMSDEEILARAKELGLVEKTVLKEPSQALSEQKTSEKGQELSELDSEETKEETTEPVTEEATEELSETTSAAESDETASEEEIEEFVVITIVSGDSSVSVSQKVFEAGLVEDVMAFDRFLCANGYDRSLRVGQHEIRVGATMQEIAEGLSNR